ncbi:MAG: glycosyltransferase [Actinomycetota bacterium]|nr:glycosyltransferase [Actinomycetota bacterium]
MTAGRPTTVIVVPCFNEAARLDPDRVHELAERCGTVLLVDDGSTDATASMLAAISAAAPGTAHIERLTANRGKAAAVRHGLNVALEGGATVVGYCDADFATPPEEMARLVEELEGDSGIDVVIGSRVALLGSDVRRSHARHYFGRVFATLASAALGMGVYDTQCGAKVFRDTPALRRALREEFRSGWAFDVELLARLRQGDAGNEGLSIGRFVEVPLRRWHDVSGSKLTPGAAVKAAIDLARIAVSGRRSLRSRATIPRRRFR